MTSGGVRSRRARRAPPAASFAARSISSSSIRFSSRASVRAMDSFIIAALASSEPDRLSATRPSTSSKVLSWPALSRPSDESSWRASMSLFWRSWTLRSRSALSAWELPFPAPTGPA